jgi:hypothetical protein
MAIWISFLIERSHWESEAREDCGVTAEEEGEEEEFKVEESIEEE